MSIINVRLVDLVILDPLSCDQPLRRLFQYYARNVTVYGVLGCATLLCRS